MEIWRKVDYGEIWKNEGKFVRVEDSEYDIQEARFREEDMWKKVEERR